MAEITLKWNSGDNITATWTDDEYEDLKGAEDALLEILANWLYCHMYWDGEA